MYGLRYKDEYAKPVGNELEGLVAWLGRKFIALSVADAAPEVAEGFNFSTVAQSPAAAVRTYIAGSNLVVPKTKIQIGSMWRWRFNLTKTAAGSAASTIDIAFGTAGTVADVARVSFTKPAGTAVVDEGWCEVIATCRGPLTAAGVVVGQFLLTHNLAATGHAVIPSVVVNTVSAGFDVTVDNLIVGLCITSGAADAITIQMCQADSFNL